MFSTLTCIQTDASAPRVTFHACDGGNISLHFAGTLGSISIVVDPTHQRKFLTNLHTALAAEIDRRTLALLESEAA